MTAGRNTTTKQIWKGYAVSALKMCFYSDCDSIGFQVIALSKQQGLLHSPRSEDGGSTLSCTGSIRYRALTDQDPSPPASTTGAVGGLYHFEPLMPLIWRCVVCLYIRTLSSSSVVSTISSRETKTTQCLFIWLVNVTIHIRLTVQIVWIGRQFGKPKQNPVWKSSLSYHIGQVTIRSGKYSLKFILWHIKNGLYSDFHPFIHMIDKII